MNIRNLRKSYALQIGVILILLVYFLFKLDDIHRYLSSFSDMMTPIFIAFALAFVLNLVVRFLENKIVYKFILKKKTPKNRGIVRGICIILSILIVFGIITTVAFVIIPKVIESLIQIAGAAPRYIMQFEQTIEKWFHISSTSEITNSIYNEAFGAWKNILSIGTNIITTSLSSIVSFTISFTSGVVDFIMSLILAIYMLFSKEMLIKQVKKVIYALLRKNEADKFVSVLKILNNSFASFITGQCTEAFIVAILSFILMTILRIPYAMLIAALLGVTGVIPILGAFIGIIPSVFLLLMISPIKAITFVIAIVALQQVESNIIYPRVVGSSVGLSSLWIMIAIIVGSYVYGILGILIGIPLISAFYKIFRDYVNKKLDDKDISI
ncbi:AI-2E family transporter [Clostridium thermobutyricum]|uniref:AI-2E family transporter n=1 Tax=Clostridium thermobutyricum TaxID=29372 RepID=UPI0018A9939D|nr:AI-2E family transporter [Clostridium thermobutyricum]